MKLPTATFRTKIIWFTLTVLLTGCSAIDMKQYRNNEPHFDLFSNFKARAEDGAWHYLSSLSQLAEKSNHPICALRCTQGACCLLGQGSAWCGKVLDGTSAITLFAGCDLGGIVADSFL